MAVCNLFNSFTKNTGNFLLFSQYNEDLTKNISMGNSYRVIPSKFIVLDINYDKVNDSLKNYDTVEPDRNLNNIIPQYFQNYFENGCAYLKNPNNFKFSDIQLIDNEWSPNLFKNMFWNSLYNINMISKVEIKNDYSLNRTFFIKEAKYIGDINLHSYNEKDGNGYSEIYCYIPNESKGYTYGNATNIPISMLCDCKPYNEYNIIQAIEEIDKNNYVNKGISDCYCGCESISNDEFQKMLDECNVDLEKSYDNNTQDNIENIINNIDDIIDVMEQYGYYINKKSYIEGFDGIADYSIDEKYGTYNDLSNNYIRTYYPNNSYINPESWMYDKHEIPELEYYKFNTIIVLYDIYSYDNKKYSDIPMGIYFTGLFDKNSVISNEVTKYITNEDIYNDGTSYGLRICSKFIISPNSTLKTIDIGLEDQNYTAFCQAMTNMSETISKMNDLLSTNINFQQTIKDELSMFKNNKTNIPYIKEIGDVDYWFVNGKLLSPAAKIPNALIERLNLVEKLLGINNYEDNNETILPAIQEEYIDEKIENTFLNIKN